MTLSLDKSILAVLRDGRVLVGILSSYDHFGSLVLESTRERISAGGKFADVPMGLYMIRGDNIVLLGELVRARAALAARARARVCFSHVLPCLLKRLPGPCSLSPPHTHFTGRRKGCKKPPVSPRGGG